MYLSVYIYRRHFFLVYNVKIVGDVDNIKLNYNNKNLYYLSARTFKMISKILSQIFTSCSTLEIFSLKGICMATNLLIVSNERTLKTIMY